MQPYSALNDWPSLDKVDLTPAIILLKNNALHIHGQAIALFDTDCNRCNILTQLRKKCSICAQALLRIVHPYMLRASNHVLKPERKACKRLYTHIIWRIFLHNKPVWSTGLFS